MTDLFNDPELQALESAGFSLDNDPELQALQNLNEQQQFERVKLRQGIEQKTQAFDDQIRRELGEQTPVGQAVGAQFFRSFPKVGRVARQVGEFATGGLIPLGADTVAAEREQDRQLFSPLEQERPVTSFVSGVAGDVAATAPIGGVGGRLAAGQAAKILSPKLAGLTGAAVTGAIEAGLTEGNPLLGAAFGAGGEYVFPIVSNVVRQAYKKFRGVEPDLDAAGRLTGPAVRELEESGFTLQQLGQEAEDILTQQFDPQAALAAQARQAEARFFDSRLTSGQAAQDRSLQALEAGAIRERGRIADAANDIMTQNQLDLVGGAERRLIAPIGSKLVMNLRDKGDNLNRSIAGDAVRTHLKARKVLATENVKNLYKAAKEIEGFNIPVDGTLLTQTMLDAGNTASKEINDSIRKVLARGGVIGKNLKDEGDGVFSVKVGGQKIRFNKKPEELTIDNADELRKQLNKISPKDRTDAAFLEQMKQSLDNSVGESVSLIPEGAAKKEAFEKARKAYSDLRLTYDDSDVVESLLKYKDYKELIPQIPDDQIVNQFFNTARSTQNLKRIKGLLLTDPAGKSVWNDIRASAAEELLKSSMTKKARTGAGDTVSVFSALNFKNKLDKMGREKFDLLFTPAEKKEFSRFGRVLGDIDMPLSFVSSSSGSGEVAENAAYKIMSRLAKMSLANRITGAVDVAESAIKTNKMDLQRRIDLQDGLESIKGRRLSPRLREATTGAFIQRYLQSLSDDAAEILGGAGAVSSSAIGELTEE